MYDELDCSPEELAVINAALGRLCGADASDEHDAFVDPPVDLLG
ncbi:MAG: hypothetical protein Q8M31_08245 [Beijerinckiaceae bacterium]|nr:hypothetical protein [Beijerinckiaceae bacterium]